VNRGPKYVRRLSYFFSVNSTVTPVPRAQPSDCTVNDEPNDELPESDVLPASESSGLIATRSFARQRTPTDAG
jgi:hypothetical protein